MSDTARERRAPAETAPRPLRIASDILFAVYLAVLLRLTVFRDGFSFDNFMLGGSLNLTFFELVKLIGNHKERPARAAEQLCCSATLPHSFRWAHTSPSAQK